MPFGLSLVDLVLPYVLQGDTFGQWHSVLSLLRVAEHEIASDENGISIHGTVEFENNLTIDPSSMALIWSDAENHPERDASRRDPYLDVRDAKLDFQLVVPRAASQKVSTAVAAIGSSASFANSAQVLSAYDTNPNDAPPSDYPTTGFVLDLLLTRVVLRPPFLEGAKRDPNGQLVPDPQNPQVKFTLPRLKFRLEQGSANNDPITATLLSAGASGLDDPGDIAVAELVTMDPPYAFIGSSRVVGFGFRSGTLDLSDQSTPPDVLSLFGFDESWTGLYLPEIRLFVAPNGARDFAVDAGIENLLIGIGASSGVTGDFSLQVLDQGAGDLVLGARFYDGDQRGYGIVRPSDTSATATVQLPASSRMVVDVRGGRTPIAVSVTVGAGSPQNTRELDIDLSGNATQTIVITASDTSSPVRSGTLTIKASRRLPPVVLPGITAYGPAPMAQIATQSTVRGSVTLQSPRLRIVSETPTTVTVGLSEPDTASPQWTVNGSSRGAARTASFDLPAGGPDVTVVATLPGGSPLTDFFFRFDQPPYQDNSHRVQTETETRSFGLDPNNTHTKAAADQGPASDWLGGSAVAADLLSALQGAGDHPIKIDGYTSYEGPHPPPSPNQPVASRLHNADLARRRALALQAIIENLIADSANNLQSRHFTVTSAPDMANWETQGYPAVETRRGWWKAVVHWPAGTTTADTTTTATLHRDRQDISRRRVFDPPPPPNAEPAPPPRWFKQMGAKVRIVRNQFVACEITAKIDIQTAAEDRLQSSLPAANSGTLASTGQPLGANPADGIIDLRLVIQIDDATGEVTVIGYYGADPADVDGLYMWGTRPGRTPAVSPGFGLDFFGTTIAFMPLISAGVGTVANDGALAELGMTAAMLAIPAVIAGLAEIAANPIKLLCERVIWYGGEIQFRKRPSGVEAVILFDMEAALSLDVSISGTRLLRINREAPLAVRYKAVGIRIGDDADQPKFQFRPVFDSSKGYTIDVSRPGAITVAQPLDSILTILGARIARNNPLIFEIDLGFAVDLGVVSIERARVRLHFDPVSPPELTAFAASIDIPGALAGRGYMEMNEKEIKGQIDLTIVPVKVRIAAGVGVAHIDDHGRQATAVIVTLEVDFPVAIPLGNSGLGIYGFLGLFAMHYARKEPTSPTMAPALAWLKDTHGNPMDIAAWEPKIDNWAFGIGAVLGTMGSSVIFNLKGVVLLELPGPRLLLVMRANLLAVLPQLKSTAEGTFLAIIDLDMGRGTLTIGISVEFTIRPLLEIHIPVEAFFNFRETRDWHLYLGRFVDQIHATILEVFEGTGYLMLSGKGFVSGELASELPVPVNGFAISTGLHVSFVWGDRDVGLYAQVAAGFDAVLGFDPFRLTGILYVRGTLHLFIIDISAWANLRVDIGELPDGSKVSRISGQICGKVGFKFFSLEGCVKFEIGAVSVPAAVAPPELFQSLRLISRSPALAVGTGIDKAIDGGIGEGIRSEVAPLPPPAPPQPAPFPQQPQPEIPMNQRRVPIDAIPLAMLAMPPLTTGAQYLFRGAAVNQSPGTPGAPADGWLQKGDDVFQYTLKSVELIGDLLDGATPAVWWPQKAGEVPAQAQLGLLSWVPDPTPKAIERSQFLEDDINETWGTVCQSAAPSASVLFTFLDQPLGPSPYGWILDGAAWPDPSDTVRSIPPAFKLKVTERWRTGVERIDDLAGVIPAVVEAAPVKCPPRPVEGPPGTAVPAEPVRLNPVTAAAGVRTPDVFDPQELTMVDIARRVNEGLEVSRSMLTRLVLTPAPPSTNIGSPCTSGVLAAPVLDSKDVGAFGDPIRTEQFRRERATRMFVPGPFDDAVVFQTGPVVIATFYLFVHRDLVEQEIVVVATTDAKDTVIQQFAVEPWMTIPPGTLPPRWTDVKGPWFDATFQLEQHQDVLQARGFVGVLVTIKGHTRADRIQIGLLPRDAGWHRKNMFRPFYVAAIEVLTSAESSRFSYDTSEQTKKQGVLGGALSGSSSSQALLKPDSAYAVRVTYDAQRGKRPPGQALSDVVAAANQHQTFWFYTDNEPPRRLDPWMLCSTPEDGEHHYFGQVPVHIVFNTPDVGRIYDAYSKRLQIRLRAASFRPLPGTPATPNPLPLTPVRMEPVKGSLLSPWEGAVQDWVAGLLSPWEGAVQDWVAGSCVPVSGDRIRHSMVKMPIPLEPFTDYLLDIEMVDKGAAEDATGAVVWRAGFSTGRFPTVAAFAASFALNRLLHRSSRPGQLQDIGKMPWAANPQGAQLDLAMIAAGLEPMGVPEAPRIVVFWEAASPNPQPAAVLVDASEPMWRSRKIPKEVTDPDPPHARRYEMTPVQWLKLVEAGGDPIVDTIVPAPGGQRALITLKPNSRGRRLLIGLLQVAQKENYLDGPAAVDQPFTVIDTILDRAPWEEED